MVREERRNRATLDLRRHQAGGDDVVKRAPSGVRGAPSGPVSEATAADVLEEGLPATIRKGGDVTQCRVPCIEVPHIDHAGIRDSGESGEINSTWSRVNIADS